MKRARVSLFCVALLPLVALSLFPPGVLSANDPGDDLPESPVVESLKRGCVMVQTPSGSGSGQVVVRGDRAYVLTAGHVVEGVRHYHEKEDGKKYSEFNDVQVVQKVVQDGREVSNRSYTAEVVRYSPIDGGEDLALLRIREKGAFKEGCKFYLGKKIPPVGTRLLHVGCPLGDMGTQSVIPGYLSAHGRLIDKNVFDQLSCNAFPGSSGGMVALEDGRYVGMVVRGRDGGFILAVPVRTIKDWAKRTGIGFILDPELPVPGEEDLKKHPIEEKR